MNIDYKNKDFLTGLALFLCSPTTLSSGVVLVGEAKGNVTLALVLVVLSCTISILTEPLMLKTVFSATNSQVAFDVPGMLKQLCFTILLPLVVGKLSISFIPPFKTFQNNHKLGFKLTSSLCLILCPWMKLSQSHSTLLSIDLKDMFFLLASAVISHLTYINYTNSLFILIFILCFLIKTPYAERKAIIILGSEKTLPVALTVLEAFPDSLGVKGLLVLPMVFGHFSQVFLLLL